MKKYKSYNEKTITNNHILPERKLTPDEVIDALADIVIERIKEEEHLYRERLKTDPKAKRFYEK